MILSILVPAYNSENTISDTLRSIEASAVPPYCPVDLYVSNNCSIDLTAQRIEDFACSHDPKRVNLTVCTQASNLGCYGNMEYLTQSCKPGWAQILCADDTLHSDSIQRICEQIAAVESQVDMIAFRDNTIHRTRDLIEQLNCSRFVSGKRGLTLFFLYGCFVGGMSNTCLRLPPDRSSTPLFNPSFQMSGDFNFYVDLLLSGGSIYLSPFETTYYRPASPLTAAAGYDCPQFPETKAVFTKCLQSISSQAHDRFLLTLFAHTVLYYQFYRVTIKRLIKGNIKAFRILSSVNTGGPFATVFWCLVSILLMPRPFREFIRQCYRLWLL